MAELLSVQGNNVQHKEMAAQAERKVKYARLFRQFFVLFFLSKVLRRRRRRRRRRKRTAEEGLVCSEKKRHNFLHARRRNRCSGQAPAAAAAAAIDKRLKEREKQQQRSAESAGDAGHWGHRQWRWRRLNSSSISEPFKPRRGLSFLSTILMPFSLYKHTYTVPCLLKETTPPSFLSV